MNYKIIESGSYGNATIVEDMILIDCGVSFKKLRDCYKNLKLVLLTHIHSDHFNKTTIKRLAQERPTLRFGCRDWLVHDLVMCGVDRKNIDIFDPVCNFKYSNKLLLTTFDLQHDDQNCGYKIMINDKKYFYATDTTLWPDAALQRPGGQRRGHSGAAGPDLFRGQQPARAHQEGRAERRSAAGRPQR